MPAPLRRLRSRLPAWALAILVPLLPCPVVFAAAVELDVPVRFQARFLTRLLQDLVFERSEGLSVWGDDSGCNDLTLRNPEVRIENGEVYILSDARAITGLSMGNRCLQFINWEGKVKALQRVDIIDPAGRIAFSTVDTTLLGKDGKPATVSNSIWTLAKEHVYPHLDRLRIDFSAAMEEVREMLPLFLQDGSREQIEELVDSFHLDRLTVTPGGITAVASFTLALAEEPVADAGMFDDDVLDDEEIGQFIELWDRLDAFLGVVIKAAAKENPNAAQKDELFDSLIETRYALVDALTNPGADDDEALRDAFINAWEHLAPVFRSLSREMEGTASLRFLGFVAAGDAIQAIDRIGAASGWDVSVAGLRRLARILIQDLDGDPLEVRPGVDPELRQIFDLGPALELPPAPRGLPPSGWRLDWFHWLAPEAVAAQELDLNKTVVGPDNIDRYLDDVHALLLAVAAGTLKVKPLDDAHHDLLRDLVLATAWQETCWRQYRQGDKDIVPMRSSAGALGVMQIMPRVWRGFYDTDALASDFEYNAAAGSEILHRYLVRYALRKGEHRQRGGADNLAKATYAAYNGGPGHLSRYRKSDTALNLRAIDESFWQKYVVVRKGDALAVRGCYHY